MSENLALRKICPLFRHATDFPWGAECRQEFCAWWLPQGTIFDTQACCAVVAIGRWASMVSEPAETEL